MSRRKIFKFTFDVAGGTGNLKPALANLARFCQDYLADRKENEVLMYFATPNTRSQVATS